MKEAAKVCEDILQYEPKNKVMLDYKKSISEYIKQGLDDTESEEEEEEEEDNEDDEEDEDSDDDGKVFVITFNIKGFIIITN